MSEASDAPPPADWPAGGEQAWARMVRDYAKVIGCRQEAADRLLRVAFQHWRKAIPGGMDLRRSDDVQTLLLSDPFLGVAIYCGWHAQRMRLRKHPFPRRKR